MISTTAAIWVTIVIAIPAAIGAYFVGAHDPMWRRLVYRIERRRADEDARAEISAELHAGHEAGLDLAERRGAAKARADCGCAEADRLAREARTEITSLRDQLDTVNRRHRRAQDLANRGGLVRASQLARALAGERLDEREAAR